MKKILSLLGTITLIGTSTTSLMACDNDNNKFEKKPLAKPQQPPEGSKWTNISRRQAPNKEFLTPTNKWYFYIRKFYDNYILEKIYFDDNFINSKNTNTHWQHLKNDSNFIWDYNLVYRWDGVGEPQMPKINNKTGKIINWN
ncbi:MAG: hypothetical protein SPLM_09510 [Spiroplasma phoeniceum]|uniref:lipoprotein n=1 Tax=Spiroplasma phoeniceum TaxID=47835 RepID=UPI003133D3B2